MIGNVVDLITVVILIGMLAGEAYLVRPWYVLPQLKMAGLVAKVNKVCLYGLFWASIGAIFLTLALSAGMPAPRFVIDVLALFFFYTFLFYVFQILGLAVRFGLWIGGRIGRSH